MAGALVKYLLQKDFKENKENIEKLELLTKKLLSLGSAPDHPIMQVLIELSQNGVVGLDKDFNIVFFNYSMTKILDRKDLQGRKIYDVFNEEIGKEIRNFIKNLTERGTTKVETGDKSPNNIYDIIAYRVTNGGICYLLYFINCMEHLLFNSENCPLKQNCPLNYKCRPESEDKK